MATATTAPTLLELAHRTNDGNVIQIAEILNQTNPILADVPIRQSNNDTVEKIARRVALPTGAFRSINQGVSVEASQTESVNEAIGMLEARSEQDADLVRTSPNPPAFRDSEDIAFVEGLGQTMASAIFYGNLAVDPEKFNGLAIRQPSILADYVYDGGGSGSDCTSVYAVKWGFQYVYGVTPRSGNPAGLSMADLGEQTVLDADSKKFQALVSLFQWKLGLAVKDPRALKRIANIETTGSTNIFDEDLLIEALNDMPGDDSNIVIYVNGTIKTQMDIAAKGHANIDYTLGEYGGRSTTFFRGVPVRKVSAILNTEDAITA